MRSERGFALLLVLWSLVLLTLITSRLIAAGRDEARLGSNIRAAASAEALADAAVHQTMFHLLDPSPSGWRPGATAHSLSLPGGDAVVRVEDEAGRVNPNQAPEALLAALLAGVGADAGTARTVAAAILDWRTIGSTVRQFGAKAPEYRAAGRDYGPPDAPFQSVGEVGLVLGMTPDLLDRLRPYLTVFYDGDPDPSRAEPIVLKAMQVAAGQLDLGGSGQTSNRTVAITAEAVGNTGGRFVRHAVVRLGSGGGRPYQVLEWRRAGG